MYELFDPRDGRPTRRYRWRIVARIVARLSGLDWAREGEGW